MPSGSRTSGSSAGPGLGLEGSVVGAGEGVVRVVVGAVVAEGEGTGSSEPEQAAPAIARIATKGRRRRTRACYRHPAA
jgi:hypothetical protein